MNLGASEHTPYITWAMSARAYIIPYTKFCRGDIIDKMNRSSYTSYVVCLLDISIRRFN
jgi:hypothetical protein